MNLQLQQRAIPYAISVRLLISSSAILALTGCITATPISVDDQHTFQPSVRAAVSLEDEVNTPSQPQAGRAIEFEYVKAKGGGSQTLPSGSQPIEFNNTTFTPPQQLRNEFDFNYADISFRWRKFFRQRALGLELSGGVGHTSLGMTVNSPTQSASQNFSNYGPQGGVALIWRMQPSTSLHARISGFVSDSSTGIRDIGRYELFITQALGDNLALRAGYAKWEVNGDSGAGQSNFKATFAGPVLDVGFNF